ncbi:paraquat-inducible protein A [Parendozoicomonas sp. Alg238-R29]|uniref:paraquat-inducible protein A n=1 Tax=Parendozoicomonas sp. Alg238-R29 TaxID=2993446 RepID=UPI00248E0C2B|nr:paraquat-inducible protein A [Parendozoicomonas sp. Alg238-R29]
MYFKTCHECGLEQQVNPVAGRYRALCSQCDGVLISYRPGFSERGLGFALAGLVMLFLSAVFPFLSLEIAGRSQNMTLFSGLETVWGQGYEFLALVIGLMVLVLPAVLLLLIVYFLLLFRWMYKAPSHSAWVGHVLEWFTNWNMADVFLIGVLVSLVKLSSMASVYPGLSFIAYSCFCICLVGALSTLDHHQLEEWQDQESEGYSEEYSNPKAMLQRCWALLFTAVICFIPANILPVTITTSVGQTYPGTILDGVIVLWGMGSYPVASVIFIASIFVPVAKILALTYLFSSVQFGMEGRQRERTTIYRLTEFFGRWSMIDVFVVAMLVSLVQFNNIVAFYAGPAVYAFLAVVVLTMLAAECFDPRLIWADSQRKTA